MKEGNDKVKATHGYAPVNGLKVYYQIEGAGEALVYIPPVFGVAGLKSFPALAENQSVISVDLQGHGRTADIPHRPMTLQQNAADVVGLLKYLGISKADFFGESYGGVMATMIAVRHPELVGRVATYGATFGPPQVALNMEMPRMSAPPTADSKAFEYQKENYKKVAPDPDYWPTFWGKVCGIQWGGFSGEELASIKAPLLIALGDHDFVRLEHAVETLKAIPNAELAVIPDAGHFALFSEPDRVIPVVEQFLRKPAKRLPIATAETGYRPGETR
ncbi:MAG: alpha/beta hydrolase [Tepidisphaeraceae bacterium]|jgi:pimeloyl-ACP methyl ester carboxylesterase